MRSRQLILCVAASILWTCGPTRDSVTTEAGTPDAAAPQEEVYPLGTEETWLQRPYLTASLRSIESLFPTRTVAKADQPSELDRRAQPFDIRYTFQGSESTLDDFIRRTDTTGLIILQGPRILYERYDKGADETSRFLSMSVAKSFTSTLLGIARDEGRIESFEDPIEAYLPQLTGTGYEGVRIKDILQMSSGVDFSEVYADAESDIARLGDACFGGPESVRDVALGYGRKREPGTVFEYASVDTLILGMLLQEVTGQSVSSYMTEKVWQPMGAESDASWVLDREGEAGFECTLGGLNATLRDYARFGLLMARDGVWNGQRLLPEGWVAEATIPDAPHVQPGRLVEGYPLGYQYQWWTFPDSDHSFTGEGIHGQLLMVNPVLDVVMVKTSDWELAWDDAKEVETWALWEAVQDWVRTEQDG